MLTRRIFIQLPAAAIAGSYAAHALAADKTVSVGINLPPLISVGVGTCGIGINVGG